jgi:hypothetical protein
MTTAATFDAMFSRRPALSRVQMIIDDMSTDYSPLKGRRAGPPRRDLIERSRGAYAARLHDDAARNSKFSDIGRESCAGPAVPEKLLDGPLIFTPKDGYYEFEGHARFAKLAASVGVQYGGVAGRTCSKPQSAVLRFDHFLASLVSVSQE